MMKCKNKKQRIKKMLKTIGLVQIAAILYSFITDFFIIPARIYSGGFTGITQIIVYSIISPDNVLSRQLWFYLVYFLINTPLIIFAWIKISKKLSMITIIFICSQEIWNTLWTSSLFRDFSIMPNLLDNNNSFGIFFFAIFGASFWAASNSIVFHAGGCGGGTDFLATYFAIYKNKSIGKYQRLFQIIVLFIAILLEFLIHNYDGYGNVFMAFLNNIIFYASLMFVIVASFVFDKCYNNTKKYDLKINGDNKFIISFLEKRNINFEIINDNVLITKLGWIDIRKLKSRIISYSKSLKTNCDYIFYITKNNVKEVKVKNIYKNKKILE